MRNEEKLKLLGLEKELRYYYLRFGEGAVNVPDGFLGVATVCIIREGECYYRGVAFCNPKDQFIKKVGRAIALGRALKARLHSTDSDPIPAHTPSSILRKLYDWNTLSSYHCTLTAYERELFNLPVNTNK